MIATAQDCRSQPPIVEVPSQQAVAARSRCTPHFVSACLRLPKRKGVFATKGTKNAKGIQRGSEKLRGFLFASFSAFSAACGQPFLFTLFFLVCGELFAADPDAVKLRDGLRRGDYDTVIKSAGESIEKRVFGEEWYLIKAEAETTVGKYAAAIETLQAGLQRYSWSVRLRQAGLMPARLASQPELATIWGREIEAQATTAPWRYTDPESLVAIGRSAIASGIDAKAVLEKIYDRAKQQNPKLREVWLAMGDLALEKQDFELAADLFRQAMEIHADDPDLLYGRARALESSDRPQAFGLLSQALAINPKHVPSLLFRVEHAIDAEQYSDAKELLTKIEAVNAHHPDAWAYRVVLATLDNDPKAADVARASALSTWARNPHVDFLIGRKLSRKYRFAEGAAHQEMALAFDKGYLPARIQLVQDWLRLGRNEDAWKLADEVHAQDGYDVHVFNLLELRDKLAKYVTLERDSIRVRMEAKEATVYGDDVLALLSRAAQTLGEKYGYQVTEPITVEIFPEPNDFAVRTFGLPGASGYLGVCFGKVITANSPASQAEHPANWQAVLWHEYCHVVTLELTHNRMPRWLSEGISVYEERQADPTWGQRMSPRYREWILIGELTPLDGMSGAFLAPESPLHLQFAYFQASLVVEFLMERGGLSSLRQVLADLATGMTAEDSLERRYSPLKQLNEEFQEYARELARRFGPDVDWEDHDLSAVVNNDDPYALKSWVDDHPTSWVGLNALATYEFQHREFGKARKTLQTLVDLLPNYAGGDSAYEALALSCQKQGDILAERQTLEKFVRVADAPASALRRLLELQALAKDWAALSDTVQRLRAINPLLTELHRPAAEAAEQLHRPEDAIAAWRSMLALGTPDRAEAHFQLAKLLVPVSPSTAKRHVLESLERAPRYRAAQDLLWELAAPPLSAVHDVSR